jgi:uncharacterized membrane protein
MGGNHSHTTVDEFDLPSGVARSLRLIAAGLALVTLAAMVLLWPDGRNRPDIEQFGFVTDFYEADVTALDLHDCPRADDGGLGGFEQDGADLGPAVTECATATFTLREGPDAGLEVSQELFDLSQGLRFDLGERVVMGYNPQSPEGFQYQFADRARQSVLWTLAAFFVVVVLALARLRGVFALIGLAASIAVLLLFVLPAIVEGASPLAVAVVGAAAIAFLALYLTHGIGDMTTVALLGTLGALGVTAALATVFVEAARLSGFADDSAFYLRAAGGQIDLQGLILAGIIIGGLGAIDDITVTQASAVWQLAGANESLGMRELFRRGMTIGRDHVASTVNTLVLAYAGAALPLLLLFVLSEQSLGTVANGEVVAIEILRTLVGSIGLVAAVPLTTWLAALTARVAT